MKNSLTVCAVALLVSGFSFADDSHEGGASPSPNLLLIVTDDESWCEHDIYGLSNLKTPHFNRLAHEGVLFTHGYTSAPSCAPSRAAILAGRNIWELEQAAFMQSFFPKKFTTIMDLLEANGYQAAFSGKRWGPGLYPQEGQYMTGTGYYQHKTKDREHRKYMSPFNVPENFEEFLGDRDETKPFIFWAGIEEPHAIWPEQEEAIRLLKEEFNVDAEKINTEPGNNPHLHPYGFYYEILHADKQTGQMLASLEKRDLLENTLVLYIGDNGSDADPRGVKEDVARAAGTTLSPERFKGKNTAYDAGCHVPMALMWKGTVPPGRVIDDFIKSTDIAPTFLEAAGVRVPASMTGKSFLDMIVSDQSGWIDPERDYVMTGSEWHTHPRTSRTIRDKRFEYIVKFPNADRSERVEELYDLKNDRLEYKNRINDPEYAAVLERLRTRMETYGRETGDPRFTGDMELFEETLVVQDALLPLWNSERQEVRKRANGKPYSEFKKYLGVEE